MKQDTPPPRTNKQALAVITKHLQDVRANRPSATMSEGRPPRTHETIRKILAAAREIFTRDGHAALTLRHVGEAAGVAVGNITYHFPTKHALLEAMLREALSDYVEEHLKQFDPGADTPLDALLNVVEFYVANARKSHRFFFQIWGYAGSSDEAKEFVRSVYQPIGRFIYYLVRDANPALTDSEIRLAVLQIFSLEEGYKLFIGMGPDDDVALQTAERDIRALTKRIVFGD